jgi:hypothetical protein
LTAIGVWRPDFGKQRVEIERAGKHAERPIDGPWPLLARTIPVEFNAVVIGIAQVKGFTDSVVGSAIERNAGASSDGERHRVQRAPDTGSPDGKGPCCRPVAVSRPNFQ